MAKYLQSFRIGKKEDDALFVHFFSYCNLNLIYRALLKNETVIYIYIKYINVEKKLAANKNPSIFYDMSNTVSLLIRSSRSGVSESVVRYAYVFQRLYVT